jgi:TonB family protein
MEQQPGIQTLAVLLAESIMKSKQKKVLVFDFAGPDADLGEVTPDARKKKKPRPPPSKVDTLFGRTLASEFSTTIGRLLPKVDIERWDQVYQTLPPNSFMPPVVEDPLTGWWATNATNFDLFIWGDFERQPDSKWKLRVQCYRVQDGGSLKGFEVSIVPGSDPKELASVTAKDALASGYPAAGKNGITYPLCVHCPEAEFPRAAIGHKAEGTVELDVVVDTDGRAEGIKVLRALPYGLTENAVTAVRGWRLKPALGPDGKPIDVRQIIEVTFYLH